jgi:DNA-binding transcriptional ArsR family regulator
MGKCIVIGAGLNITPARITIINSDVNDGSLIILVGLSGDALGALAEFTSQVYQDLGIKIEQFILNPRASLTDTVAGLRSFIKDYAPCSLTIGVAGDRWVTTVLGFLAMVLATVGSFTGISVDRVFVVQGEKGGVIDWPIVPRFINLSQTEYRVLRLICDGHALAKEVAKAYGEAFKEGVSIQVVERVLARLRARGLVTSKPSGKAYLYDATVIGRLLACRVPVIRGGNEQAGLTS